MAKMIVSATTGFSCDGNGKCGGTDFISRENIYHCFHCEDCPSFQRNGLKIIDERVKKESLLDFFGGTMKKTKNEYLNEYRTFIRERLAEDVAALEDMNDGYLSMKEWDFPSFKDWLLEEEYEEKIRCPKCDSFNTRAVPRKMKDKIVPTKVCDDCDFESKITKNNQANMG